ncbi:MAG: hypothetical protein HY592_05035 [Candidatus Omnitrophica bacterium]|nr:hypothetical protein [Candidatus Omnitrophota bacterium]
MTPSAPSVTPSVEGYWDVRQVNGKWMLWNPRIREVKEPALEWFIDLEFDIPNRFVYPLSKESWKGGKP